MEGCAGQGRAGRPDNRGVRLEPGDWQGPAGAGAAAGRAELLGPQPLPPPGMHPLLRGSSRPPVTRTEARMAGAEACAELLLMNASHQDIGGEGFNMHPGSGEEGETQSSP